MLYANIEAIIKEGVTSISLRSVKDSDISDLVGSIVQHGSKIKILDFFDSNKITATGIQYLMQAYGDKLEALSITSCALKDEDVAPILQRAKEPGFALRDLNLEDNCLTANTVQAFATLRLESLTAENQYPPVFENAMLFSNTSIPTSNNRSDSLMNIQTLQTSTQGKSNNHSINS